MMNMLARSNRIQTGCSLRVHRFFRNFCFSETNNTWLNRLYMNSLIRTAIALLLLCATGPFFSYPRWYLISDQGETGHHPPSGRWMRPMILP
uniref:Uncharacterized protein n=1 Tax=Candidatus Kentrum sp. LPFa TaxID=2126335 RepID=A0A450WCD1_9GAMM|nr:MAG: hypothetical protein BECKLPF1236A_GA0070988_101103 [Candidatus Kentron sp. LPFa]VFK30373.1 MAG: hypothetical protein BECKLPF1236C_GA0070990_101093 [Candidatus Kentron sp. LPFa]